MSGVGEASKPKPGHSGQGGPSREVPKSPMREGGKARGGDVEACVELRVVRYQVYTKVSELQQGWLNNEERKLKG